MSMRFAFVCENRFSDLPGDEIIRHCDQCDSAVVDFDRLGENARSEILALASKTGFKLCVSISSSHESSDLAASESSSLFDRSRRPIMIVGGVSTAYGSSVDAAANENEVLQQIRAIIGRESL